MTCFAFVFLFRVFRVSIGLSHLILVRTLRGPSTQVRVEEGGKNSVTASERGGMWKEEQDSRVHLMSTVRETEEREGDEEQIAAILRCLAKGLNFTLEIMAISSKLREWRLICSKLPFGGVSGG